ncbi:MAG: tRNA dihydrouridine synthase DusB [Elusimicrobia bacterium CG_4_10_14_0_8_um_filter_37_32]|nr:MAG: tRNA dihydrouridine synthase DusB [Elusimicrobia bacterium CG02_land_8_20_14_3_00_37_13]PIZ13533.1 MAG: tRNA dihydrouridine synthase DusB [Elusimicrobia bacterium CG_4_10_14_0_8_um_filter_37_32]
MLEIGKLKIDPPVILSSLSGISDLAFRTISRRFGCPFAFYEMFDYNSILRKNKRTFEIQMKTNDTDKPLGAQLLGNDPEALLETALVLQEKGIDLIDINSACPVKKVLKRKCGAYLLKDTHVFGLIIKKLANGLRIPVSVKIRTGSYTANKSINALEVSKIAEGSGAKAIFIHGRTAEQKYNGQVSYETISAVKKAVKIPVIASGDIFSGPSAKKMFDETGCDGILVARGALGNPWIFSEIKHYLEKGTVLPPPTMEEIKNVSIDHLKMSVELHDERIGIYRMRKLFCRYFSNFPGAKHIRTELTKLTTVKDIMDFLIYELMLP